MNKIGKMDKPRVLFSIPTRSHVAIAVDEMTGMRELGYTCDPFSFSGRENVRTAIGRLLLIIYNAFSLSKKAREFKPDFIYLNSRLEVLAGIRDALTIFIVKTFYRGNLQFLIKSHGSDLEVLSSSSFITKHITLPYLRKHVAGWLFLSSEEKQGVLETGYFQSQTIFQVKNIVRSDQFELDPDFKSSLGISAETMILLFTGRIIREKGVFEVLEAIQRIKEQFLIKLIIVGDGDDYAEMKMKIADLGITSSVILVGLIPEKEVVRFYSNSDILVFPTYFPEGFPMSLFNSVGAGLAIVTTRNRASADYLTQPENCLWVKPRNSDSVYSALTKLLSSEELRKKMNMNNRVASKQFSKEQVCHELEAIFASVRNANKKRYGK